MYRINVCHTKEAENNEVQMQMTFDYLFKNELHQLQLSTSLT
jgi:hypothetical protein